jgi:hypothetical protein
VVLACLLIRVYNRLQDAGALLDNDERALVSVLQEKLEDLQSFATRDGGLGNTGKTLPQRLLDADEVRRAVRKPRNHQQLVL